MEDEGSAWRTKPVDEGTPRLVALGHRRAWWHLKLRRQSWSGKAMTWLEVPEPGGRYRARLAGTPEEHEEHVLLAQRAPGGALIPRRLDRVQGLG